MQIYIIRHAKVDWKKNSKIDIPVSEEGMDDARRVIELSRRSFGFRPNIIASSPIVRCKQTAEITKKELGMKSAVLIDDCLDDSKPEAVYRFLSKFKKTDRVVLVSHMPVIFELLYDLIGGRAEIELLNGSIACVQCEDEAGTGKGKLTWLAPPPSSPR